MPDLRDLDHFDEGLPAMPQLPAAEIRRRGDRLRRRRTALVTSGAVLAVAIAVGAPVVALSGAGNDIDPAPPPSTETTEPHWLTAIPADFPLDDDFPRPAEVTDALGGMLLPICSPFFSGPVADQATVTYTGTSGDRTERWLVLFNNDSSALAAMDQMRSSLAVCTGMAASTPSDVTKVYDEVPVDLRTEDSFAWTEEIQHEDGGLLSDLTYVQVALTGNAIYVESSYGLAQSEDAIAMQALLTKRAAGPLGLMCIYAADPCLDPEAPGGGDVVTAPPTSVTVGPGEVIEPIRDDFPLDVGITVDGDSEMTGPGRDVEGVDLTDLCGPDAWMVQPVEDVLAVRVSGPEYSLTRQLETFADAETAAGMLADLRTALAACPVSGHKVFTGLAAQTAYDDSVTFSMTYDQGLGGALYQVVRVGRAVLLVAQTGEYSPETVADGVPQLTQENQRVTDLMCVFTEAGCV